MNRVDITPFDHALRVIGITALAWRVTPESAHAVARRAPVGYVPFRSLRRMRHAAREALAHPQFLAQTW